MKSRSGEILVTKSKDTGAAPFTPPSRHTGTLRGWMIVLCASEVSLADMTYCCNRVRPADILSHIARGHTLRLPLLCVMRFYRWSVTRELGYQWNTAEDTMSRTQRTGIIPCS